MLHISEEFGPDPIKAYALERAVEAWKDYTGYTVGQTARQNGEDLRTPRILSTAKEFEDFLRA